MGSFQKFPYVDMGEDAGGCWSGAAAVGAQLRRAVEGRGQQRTTLVIECYPGFDGEALAAFLRSELAPGLLLDAADAYLSSADVAALVAPELTDDPLFGKLSHLSLQAFFSPTKLAQSQAKLASHGGLAVVFGAGATLLAKPDVLVYLDLARWELQLRFRAKTACNLAAGNFADSASLQYKRAYFIDWRVADKHKKLTMPAADFVIDGNRRDHPKMIAGETFKRAMHKAVSGPLSLVPFFDPGPWGGQWMKKVCDLDPAASNYAWCFNCVPEENSLLLGFGDERFELPAIDLVFFEPRALLGEQVHARFGTEFPIRFDFLDTVGGGNLSLQVHPLTEYIQDQFGMHYTQDESYYLLDAEPDARVYLGLKDGVQPEAMIAALQEAQASGGTSSFDAEAYVQTWPARKHDHFLIPAGTVHCSGAGAMVLEISATPYIFTFKLWDWQRLGLDGKPRPINIEHGRRVIQWDRTTEWTREHLVNRVRQVAAGEGWTEEVTGLHEREFIETRRHWFTKPVAHDTAGTVHVLSLVDGEEVTVESPSGAFAPFVVHYAETFIVPARVGAYVVRPSGLSLGKTCATIKAYVR